MNKHAVDIAELMAANLNRNTPEVDGTEVLSALKQIQIAAQLFEEIGDYKKAEMVTDLLEKLV
jgi:hypothetical protein